VAISWSRVGAGHANNEFSAARNGGKIAKDDASADRRSRDRKAAFRPSRPIGLQIARFGCSRDFAFYPRSCTALPFVFIEEGLTLCSPFHTALS